MLTKSSFRYISLAILATQVISREFMLERDNRPVYLYPRRFGQEQPAVLQKLRDACPGQFCGTLAGQAVTPLLAAQGECTQQDMADAIIDASKQFDAATQANMVAIAVEYRQVEKNTPPDFTTNPPSLRNSVFCQKAPKNAQLNGLVQAQDPANDPDLFFDPATQATVKKGAQPNTFPLGDAAMAQSASTCNDVPVTSTVYVVSSVPTPAATAAAGANFGSCSIPQIEFGVGFDGRKETSFQPTDKKSFNHGSAQNIAIITQFICDRLNDSCKANQSAKDICANAQTAAAAAAAKTGAQADVFNAAFGIKTQFVNVPAVDDQGNVIAGTGNTVTNPSQPSTTPAAGADFGSCSVPQIEFGVGFDGRKETSFQPTNKTSFNHGSAQNVGVITQFICDTLTNSCKANQAAKDTCKTAQTAAAAATAGTGAQADAFNSVFGVQTQFISVPAVDNQGNIIPGTGSPTASPTAAAAPADFGSCSVPQIEFGVGFDGRRETSFQPIDKQSYNHGSAQNIGIITEFICDTLTNSCKANQPAKDICAKAQAAASTAVAKTGAQADAFNAVFGIKTNFTNVSAVDDQGNIIAGTGNPAASPTAAAAADFGSCSVPQIEFGVGFDGRRETSFQPTDKQSFNHGSAQNIGIITQFMCDTLTNSCKANQSAKDICAKAQTAATAAAAKTGAQADAFNSVFGIKSQFAYVPSVDDQGRVIAGTGKA